VANIALYSEGVFTGYRWYDQRDVAPAFPFGFGLSYTTFSYANLALAGTASAATVSFSATNTGNRSGIAVPQVYIGMPAPAGIQQPPRQLKGFARLSLNPGETRPVTIALDERAFSYWDVVDGGWKVEPGCYAVMIGTSSRDIVLQGSLARDGGNCS
jgi:beta-glucosidase